MSYLPLDFINASPDAMQSFENLKKTFVELGIMPADTTYEEYKNYIFSRNFFSPVYDGKFKALNNFIMKNYQFILELTGCSLEDIQRGDISLRTEWMDFLIASAVTDEWALNKQVYKVDKEFAKALLSTDKLQLYKTQLDHLPNKLFYVDLTDCDFFAPAHGVWCNVRQVENYVNIYFLILKNDMIFYSWGTEAYFSPDGLLDVEKPDNPTKEFTVYTPDVDDVCNATLIKQDRVFNIADVAMLCLQLLGYITSKEPDIEESPITQRTYRPGKTIKNKFSEVRQQDVGVRYGKAIGVKMKEIREPKPVEEKGEHKVIYRKPPKPHFRSAHWAHYWTGKGRTTLEVRWIEPTFVGFKNGNSANTDVVIHKVNCF